MTAEGLIAALNLQPHPKEGGYFRETYRSAEEFSHSTLPDRYRSNRSHSTAIYYLLTPTTFSPFIAWRPTRSFISTPAMPDCTWCNCFLTARARVS